jgi:hypothetical protein
MPRTYTIASATYALFARHAQPGAAWRNTSRPRSDGRLDLTLADDVAQTLESMRLPEETDGSDLALTKFSKPLGSTRTQRKSLSR